MSRREVEWGRSVAAVRPRLHPRSPPMTRSRMMVIAVMLAVGIGPLPAVAGDRPNVIVFVSDDHRADVLGCAGHAIVRTPHIDRLASDGVRFANAFVTTSICAASRAGSARRAIRSGCASMATAPASSASSAFRSRAAGRRSTRCSTRSCRSGAPRT
ncbi:MAG: sulfatase-like hydrolase/transferase [Planctomycetota bacterium]